MQGQDHSYLDLSVLPEISEHILSHAPVVLIKQDLSAILWANAAGARLFGGTGVVQLLAASLNESQSFTRQLSGAIAQMSERGRIIRGFRLSRDEHSVLLQFEISHITLPNDAEAYLVQNLNDEADEKIAEHILANNTVKSLEGFADASAILDDHGLVISASSEFNDIGPSDDVLEKIVQELNQESDQLIKRPIEAHTGEMVIAGLAKFQSNPGRSLIVLARANPIADDAFDADSVDVPLLDEAHDDEKVVDKEEVETPLAFEEASEEIVTEEPQEPETEREDEHRILTESSISLEKLSETETEASSQTDENKDQANDDSDTQQSSFSFEKEENTTRFAWVADPSCVFTSVSPELAQTVGPNAAAIVGRKWTDIATVFGFDNNGEIANLLSKEDTWSGKTVLWPIQGTDLVVPVDLAALPVFDSTRSFQGFRGFGIIRSEDTVLDPDETGLALVSIESPKDNTPDIDENTDEPEIRIQQNDEDEKSAPSGRSNIVRLVPKTTQTHPNTLSEKENRALEDIRRRLGGNNPRDANEKSEASETAEQLSKPNRRTPNGHLDTSLLENLPIAVLVYRTDETLYANREMLEITGYETLKDLANAGGIDTILNPGLEDDIEPGMQYLIRKDGTRSSIKPILQTVPWSGDKALMLSFAAKNEVIIQQTPALEISKSTEIQSILDTASDGIILTEKGGNIISVNASAEVLFGCAYEDIQDQFIWELFADESKEVISEYMEAIATPGVETLLNDGREVIGIEAQGGTIPIFLTITEMQSSSKLCVMLRDMTEWKIAEEELINARRNAEDANEQKSEFLAHVSHEIRTPLNAIIGFSDVMLEERFGPINNQRYREYLRDINRSGSHVLELVNDLLDLSKIEAGKLELSFEAVDLNQIVAESVALLQPQANSNRIIIRTSLSRAVPKVVADTRSMRQIILNLVSNAIKFSDQNSQVIVSTVYENSGEVALRVRDTGKGMTDSELIDAMKPFQQVHKVSEEKQAGTGLGLPLTKALVEANRAHFSIESEPDSGTIANVNFPNQRVLAD